MADDPLKKLFMAFGGDTKKIAFFVKEFGGLVRFGEELKDAKWKSDALEKKLLKNHKDKAEEREKAIADGENQRLKDAAAEAKRICKADDVRHKKVKRLLVYWLAVKAEHSARGLDKPEGKPNLDFLAMGVPSKVGDAALNKKSVNKELVNQLVEQESIFIFNKKVFALLNDVRAEKQSFEDSGTTRYKDSRQKLDELEQEVNKMKVALEELYAKAAPAQKMTFTDQNLVPSAKDMGGIEHRLDNTEGIQTESQAWSLEAADKKGEDELALSRLKALQRLEELNSKYNTSYKETDLDKILKHLASGKIATNYNFNEAPGANRDVSAVGKTPLMDLMMKSDHFKNVWETGTSQASTDRAKRGGVEERMGYSSPLKRTAGTPHTYVSTKDGAFDPGDKSEEMPKYAAVIGDEQKDGVALRFGRSYVIWKESVRERITHTPKDSWNQLLEGVDCFTSNAHPEIIFAKCGLELARLAAADATGKDTKFLWSLAEKGGLSTQDYIETQIHGLLTWKDVDTLVIGEDDATTIIEKFEAFKKKKGYNFKVQAK